MMMVKKLNEPISFLFYFFFYSFVNIQHLQISKHLKTSSILTNIFNLLNNLN